MVGRRWWLVSDLAAELGVTRQAVHYHVAKLYRPGAVRNKTITLDDKQAAAVRQSMHRQAPRWHRAIRYRIGEHQ